MLQKLSSNFDSRFSPASIRQKCAEFSMKIKNYGRKKMCRSCTRLFLLFIHLVAPMYKTTQHTIIYNNNICKTLYPLVYANIIIYNNNNSI